MVNPGRAERSGVARALRVGGLTLGAAGGVTLRVRNVTPRSPTTGGGLGGFRWGAAPTARSAALFVQAGPPDRLAALLARRPAPAALLAPTAHLLWRLTRR